MFVTTVICVVVLYAVVAGLFFFFFFVGRERERGNERFIYGFCTDSELD